jgi:hypothetical protein
LTCIGISCPTWIWIPFLCQLSFMLIKAFLVFLFSSAKIKCIKKEHLKSHVFSSWFWESNKRERKRVVQ